MSSRTLPVIRGFLVILVTGFALSGILGMFGASETRSPLGLPPASLKRSIVAALDAVHPSSQRRSSAPQSSGPAHTGAPSVPATAHPVATAHSNSTSRSTVTPAAGVGSVKVAAPSTKGSAQKPTSATHKGASAPTAPAATQFVPVAGATCAGCRVSQGADGSIGATIPAEGDVTDSAYALLDFGGAKGVAGPLFVREWLSLGAGQVPSGDLHVSQVTDVNNRVLYRLVISGGTRELRLTSPPGGLNADPIDIDTGVAVPNDGDSRMRVSVSFDPAGTLLIRVNGQEVARRTDLQGESTGPARYLAAGIVASDPSTSASATTPITVVHSSITAGPAAPGGGAPAQTPTPKLAPGPPTKVVVPSAVTPPSLSGEAAAGSVLTASLGVWSDPKAQLDAQWERCDAAGQQCVAIPGATGVTYTATNADVGLTLRVHVRATNSAGTGSAFSSSTDPVLTAGVPISVSPPTISGTAVTASLLTGDPGTWSDTISLALAWERCDATGANCVAVADATQTTFQLGPADIGSTIRLLVTATGRTATRSAESAPTAVVAVAAPTVVTLPSITGATTVGATLVASPGVWSDPNAQLTYAWLRCDAGGTCAPIEGATASTFALTSAEIGLTIEVVVTATNATGTASATSAPTAVVTAPASPPPPTPPAGTDTGGGTPPPTDTGGGTPPPTDTGGGAPPPTDTGGGTPPTDNQGTPPGNEGTSPGNEGTSGGDSGTPPAPSSGLDAAPAG